MKTSIVDSSTSCRCSTKISDINQFFIVIKAFFCNCCKFSILCISIWYHIVQKIIYKDKTTKFIVHRGNIHLGNVSVQAMDAVKAKKFTTNKPFLSLILIIPFPSPSWFLYCMLLFEHSWQKYMVVGKPSTKWKKLQKILSNVTLAPK